GSCIDKKEPIQSAKSAYGNISYECFDSKRMYMDIGNNQIETFNIFDDEDNMKTINQAYIFCKQCGWKLAEPTDIKTFLYRLGHYGDFKQTEHVFIGLKWNHKGSYDLRFLSNNERAYPFHEYYDLYDTEELTKYREGDWSCFDLHFGKDVDNGPFSHVQCGTSHRFICQSPPPRTTT
ncbi:unnamed protein product, partial [Meganyctiphanes norvegica]